jgi:inorganic phosphate transporter, PiT family
VRWGVAGNILVAWIITIPCAGLVAAAMEYVTRLPGGVLCVFLLTAGIAALAFTGRRIEARRYKMASAPAPS